MPQVFQIEELGQPGVRVDVGVAPLLPQFLELAPVDVDDHFVTEASGTGHLVGGVHKAALGEPRRAAGVKPHRDEAFVVREHGHTSCHYGNYATGVMR